MSAFSFLLKVWHQPIFKRIVLFVAGIVPDRMYVRLTARGKLGYNIFETKNGIEFPQIR